MKLSQAIEVYIAYKRSLGMGFRSEAVILRAFIKRVGDGDMRKVRPQAVRQYLDGKGQVTSFWFAKYHTLTAFYRYAVARHYVQKSPLPRSKPQPPEKLQPYIYSNEDKEFHVGNECIKKAGDAGLYDTVKKELRRMKNQAEADAAAATFREGRDILARADVRASLSIQPHPNSFFAAKGKTMADYYEFLLHNSPRGIVANTVGKLREFAAESIQ